MDRSAIPAAWAGIGTPPASSSAIASAHSLAIPVPPAMPSRTQLAECRPYVLGTLEPARVPVVGSGRDREPEPWSPNRTWMEQRGGRPAPLFGRRLTGQRHWAREA